MRYFVLVGFGVFSSSLHADQIWLTNGDLLSGKLLYMSDEKLIFESGIAGRVAIPWKKIKTLESDDALIIELHGQNDVQQYRLAQGRAGTVNTADNREIQLTEIKMMVRPRARQRTWRFEGNLDLSTDIKRNQSDKSDSIETRLDTRITDLDWRHALKFDYTYQTEENVESERNYTLEYSLDRFFADTWYWRLHTAVTRDYFDDNQRDTQYGTGPGYQFWDDEQGRFGINLTYTHYRFSRDFEEDIVTVDRLSLNAAGIEWDIKQAFIGTDVEAYASGNVIFPDAFDINYVCRTKQGLRYHINGRVNFSLHIDYDELDAKTINERDREYVFGVGVDW